MRTTKLVDVGAGGERLVAGAGQDQDAHVAWIGGDLRQPLIHRKRQRVARLRAIEGDAPDAVARLVQQFVCHRPKHLRVVLARAWASPLRGCGRWRSKVIGRPTTFSPLPGSVRIMSIACNCSVSASSAMSLTGAQGTPASPMMPSQSCRVRGQQHRLHRVHHRVAVGGALAAVGQRGSSHHSGWPIARASFTNSRSLPAAMQIGRSAVSKIWYGASVARGGAMPLRQLAGDVVAVQRPLHPGHRALEQRGIDHAAAAGVARAAAAPPARRSRTTCRSRCR